MGCVAASKGSNCHVWIPEELLRGGGPKKKGAKIGDETDLYLDINKAALAPTSTTVEVKDRGDGGRQQRVVETMEPFTSSWGSHSLICALVTGVCRAKLTTP